MLQEQAQVLKLKQTELQELKANINKEKNTAVGFEGLSSILNTLTKEISALKVLPEQVQWLTERVTNLSITPKETQFNKSPTCPDSFVTTVVTI